MQLGIKKLLVPSNEAIAFQGASPLATELMMIFQDVIDYKNKLLANKDPNVVEKVLKYHQDTVPKKFRASVKKHTGLDARKFTTAKRPSLGYACMMAFGDGYTGWLLSHDAKDRYSGRAAWEGEIPASEEQIRKAYEEIANLLDTETGKLKSNKFKFKGRVQELRFDVFFCAHSAYMAKLTLGEKAEEFTAAEVAATMLHEIGHMMSVIEHAADLIKSVNVITAKISHNGIEEPDPKKMSQSLATAADALKKFKTEDKELSIQLNRIASSVQSVSDLPKETSVFERIGGVFKALGRASFNVAKSGVEMICVRMLMPIFSGSKYRKELMDSFKNKTSDFMMTYGDRAIGERYADQYVSQHGLGAANITGLQKTDTMLPLISLKATGHPAMRESVVVYNIAKFEIFVTSLMIAFDQTSFGKYEKEMDRADSMLRDIIQAFKTVNLPPEMLDFYIADYEETRKAIADVRKKFGVSGKLKQFNVFLTQTASFPHLVRLLTTGAIDTKYRKLMDSVNDINNSSLYFWAAKFDQLSRK